MKLILAFANILSTSNPISSAKYATVIDTMKPFTTTITNIFSRPLILFSLSFLIPFLGFPNQIVIGTLVNALLFSVASDKKNTPLLPLYILPSIGTIARNLVFGPNTVFLYYFLPSIWASNAILVWVFKKLQGKPIILQNTSAAVAKFLILQLSAVILYQTHLVPKQFLLQMGVIQLGTALLGAYIATLLIRYERK